MIFAQYTFNPNTADVIPSMSSGFTYTSSDVTNGDGTITRTLSCEDSEINKLTRMQFGQNYNAENDATLPTTSALIRIDLLNAPFLTTVESMFRKCENLTSIKNATFVTNKVANASGVFELCTNLVDIDLSSWNVENVTNMNCMFQGCTKLKNLDLSNWKATSLLDTNSMFSNCNSIEELNLNGFKINNVTSTWEMFNGCSSLTHLDISNWNLNSSAYIEGTFTNCNNLTNVSLIYSNKYTINKMTELLQKTNPTTVFIMDTNLSNCTPRENIEFRVYEEQNKRLELFSPLLKYDKIIQTKEGIWHYHRCEKIVLNKNSEIYQTSVSDLNSSFYSFAIDIPTSFGRKSKVLCDNFEWILNGASNKRCVYFDSSRVLNFHIEKSLLSSADLNGVKSWLESNPTTAVYLLETPYYEKISNTPISINHSKDSLLEIKTSFPLNTTINSYHKDNLITHDFGAIEGKFGQLAGAKDGKAQVGEIEGNYMINIANQKEFSPLTIEYQPLDTLPIKTQGGDGICRPYIEGKTLYYDNNYQTFMDYFDGSGNLTFKSSYEDGLITDRNNINYNKYKVEVQTIGKNILKGTNMNVENEDGSLIRINGNEILIRPSRNGKASAICGSPIIPFNFSEGSEITISVKKNDENIWGSGEIDLGIELFNQNNTSSSFLVTMDSESVRGNNSFTLFENYEKMRIYISANNITDASRDFGFSIQAEVKASATEFEAYKEKNKTYYLDTPLLEGDTIESINGKTYHVKKSKRISYIDDWVIEDISTHSSNNNLLIVEIRHLSDWGVSSGANTCLSNKFNGVYSLNELIDNNVGEGIAFNGETFTLVISKSNLTSEDEDGIRQHIRNLEIVYKLNSPINVLLENNDFLMDAYSDGHFLTPTNIPPNVKFKALEIPLRYAPTDYVIQYTKLNNSVEVIEEIRGDKLILSGVGTYIGEVMVVYPSTAKIESYFEGIRFSYDDTQVKSKNLFNGILILGGLDYTTGEEKVYADRYRSDFIEVKANTQYVMTKGNVFYAIVEYDSSKNFIMATENNTIRTSSKTKYIRVVNDVFSKVQVEEGSVSTEYEIYDLPHRDEYEVILSTSNSSLTFGKNGKKN